MHRRVITAGFLIVVIGIVALVESSSVVVGQPAPPSISTPLPCTAGIIDQANSSNCLVASTMPGTIGQILPQSIDLFVTADGRVGMGTTTPEGDLDIVDVGDAEVHIDSLGGATALRFKRNSDPRWSIISEFPAAGDFTIFRHDTGQRKATFQTGFTTYSTSGAPNARLTETAGSDGNGGFLATYVGDGEDLVRLTTTVGDQDSGFLSVWSNRGAMSTAGINGNSGDVFGATKSFVQPHPTDATREIRYVALEGPENGVYFRGSSRLVDGVARIEVPESFRLVAREAGLTVQITPTGASRGLYIESKDLDGIVVRENPGGDGDVAFDYHVHGVRSALPEHVAIQDNALFAPRPDANFPEGTLPGYYRQLMIQNGTLHPDGTVDRANAAKLGWTGTDELGWERQMSREAALKTADGPYEGD